MFNSLFGKINWFNVGIVSGAASAFSWFVLSNTPASVFFLIGAAVVFAIAFIANQNDEKTNELHRLVDDRCNSSVDHVDRVENRIDSRFDGVWNEIISIRESIANLDSKRK